MSGSASAPGSSANLGPGFDVLGLALEVRCRITAEPAADWLVSQDGEEHEPAPDEFVRRAVAAATDGVFRIEIANAVPRARGLGSSAAVAVAAAAAAIRARGEEPTSRFLFETAAQVDGHPDNAAAAVYGGLVAVGSEAVRHLELHPDLRIVVGVPDGRLTTADARAALPDRVDRAVAARSLARLLFLIEGLRTADRDALAAAGGDEMHESPRRDLSPITTRLVEAAMGAGALHAAWSGAGPSAIAFVTEAERSDVTAAMADALGGGGEVRSLNVATSGWR